jgi:hypothetical protein
MSGPRRPRARAAPSRAWRPIASHNQPSFHAIGRTAHLVNVECIGVRRGTPSFSPDEPMTSMLGHFFGRAKLGGVKADTGIRRADDLDAGEVPGRGLP